MLEMAFTPISSGPRGVIRYAHPICLEMLCTYADSNGQVAEMDVQHIDAVAGMVVSTTVPLMRHSEAQ